MNDQQSQLIKAMINLIDSAQTEPQIAVVRRLLAATRQLMANWLKKDDFIIDINEYFSTRLEDEESQPWVVEKIRAICVSSARFDRVPKGRSFTTALAKVQLLAGKLRISCRWLDMTRDMAEIGQLMRRWRLGPLLRYREYPDCFEAFTRRGCFLVLPMARVTGNVRPSISFKLPIGIAHERMRLAGVRGYRHYQPTRRQPIALNGLAYRLFQKSNHAENGRKNGHPTHH